MMNISEINTASPFRDLFPIEENIVKEIMWDIQKKGFDESKPIVLWKGRLIVIDGHTRLRAAQKAGLEQVPVVMKDFDDTETALEYAIKSQRNRRNLKDIEILQCVAALDKRQHSGQRNDLAPCGARLGKTSEETAKTLGISSRKVERARAVLDKASEEVKEAVKSGEMSINSAYNKTVNPDNGGSDALESAADEIGKIDKVFRIIKKRLTMEQIRELVKRLQEEL